MRTIYKVNGKQVSLEKYLFAEYQNTWNDLRQYSLERFLKKHPDIIQEAMELPDLATAKSYIISEWKRSEEYADYVKAYSKTSPEKEAKEYAGCMIAFWVILTILCIIGIACGLD